MAWPLGGLTHEPAVRPFQLLIDIAPKGVHRDFLGNFWSVAVEVFDPITGIQQIYQGFLTNYFPADVLRKLSKR